MPRLRSTLALLTAAGLLIAPAVASAEDERLELRGGNDRRDFLAGACAKRVQLIFERIASVDGESRCHLAEK